MHDACIYAMKYKNAEVRINFGLRGYDLANNECADSSGRSQGGSGVSGCSETPLS